MRAKSATEALRHRGNSMFRKTFHANVALALIASMVPAPVTGQGASNVTLIQNGHHARPGRHGFDSGSRIDEQA